MLHVLCCLSTELLKQIFCYSSNLKTHALEKRLTGAQNLGNEIYEKWSRAVESINLKAADLEIVLDQASILHE
jgi:hypothetical protein